MTLIEMMIALVILGIMGIALVGFLRVQHQTVLRQNDGVLATQNARAAVDMLVRELRNAGYDPRRSVAGGQIRSMESDSIAWTADLDLDGDTLSSSTSWDERVSYYESGGHMMRATGGGAGTALTDNVDSLRFVYLDGDGAVTADPDVVEQVRVGLFYSTPDGVQTGVIRTQIALRNNIYRN